MQPSCMCEKKYQKENFGKFVASSKIRNCVTIPRKKDGMLKFLGGILLAWMPQANLKE